MSETFIDENAKFEETREFDIGTPPIVEDLVETNADHPIGAGSECSLSHGEAGVRSNTEAGKLKCLLTREEAGK